MTPTTEAQPEHVRTMQEEEYRALFDVMDTDGSGGLDLDELRECFDQLDIGISTVCWPHAPALNVWVLVPSPPPSSTHPPVHRNNWSPSCLG